MKYVLSRPRSLSFNLNLNCPLKVNSFALRADNNGEEENVGTALYRANSIFDHSCRPNATTVFCGKKLYIKSMISMASLELGQFYISYLDQAVARDSRRAKLSGTWYFDCGCPACCRCRSTAPASMASTALAIPASPGKGSTPWPSAALPAPIASAPIWA